ncbi:MAG TPA: efflux RND transporter periplasmic adaptor subunit [Bryobacteraceae bacterium]|jgi:HlyD family secretion protein|nr:efflux RND transporter periplasmic adaptor subunit [Bryobacteraceae bacterium]
MKKRIIPVVAIVLIATAAVVLWSGGFRRDDAKRIRLSGNIELTEVDISFKIPGKLIERTVDEGDAVKKGQLVARIDQLQSLQQKAAQQASVQSAAMQLAQSLTLIAWQKATIQGDLAMRRAEVEQAQAHVDELLAGARPQEVEEAQAAVADARSQAEQARLDWERAQTLFKNDDISRAQYDQAQARWNSARAILKQAEERWRLVKEGPRQEQIAAARAALARAQAALRVSEANELEIRRREQELSARKAELERAKAQLGVADSQLQDTTVYSPVDGVVLVKSAEVGEVLAAGATVVTIGDLDHPWLRGYINETDLGRVKLGQRVKVTTDSFPGKVYQGRISFIASDAEFTPKQIQTPEERVKLVYRIKVDVENPNRELKGNMPVDAEIEF